MASVFIVDDDKAVRDALRFAFEVEGFSVRVFDSAAALLADCGGETCRAVSVDPRQGGADGGHARCLVIDQLMPAMTGLDLIHVLRERGCHWAAILITTRANRELRRRATLLGVRHVLEKPLSGSALIECARDTLLRPVPEP